MDGLEFDECFGLRYPQLSLPSAGVAASAAFSPAMILQARQGFQTQLSQTLSSAATSFDNTSAAVVSAAALFEELLPALAASNGPVRALLGEGSGPSAAVALYHHAVDAIPTEVLPTTFFTEWYCVVTLNSTWLQLKLAIVNLPSSVKLLLLLCFSQFICVSGTLQVCLAVKSSVCARDSACIHELTRQLHNKALWCHCACQHLCPASCACLAYHWSVQKALQIWPHRASDQKQGEISISRSTV
jgi:hypothetical protein